MACLRITRGPAPAIHALACGDAVIELGGHARRTDGVASVVEASDPCRQLGIGRGPQLAALGRLEPDVVGGTLAFDERAQSSHLGGRGVVGDELEATHQREQRSSSRCRRRSPPEASRARSGGPVACALAQQMPADRERCKGSVPAPVAGCRRHQPVVGKRPRCGRATTHRCIEVRGRAGLTSAGRVCSPSLKPERDGSNQDTISSAVRHSAGQHEPVREATCAQANVGPDGGA